MAELKVRVRNKIATGDGQRIVCDNTDYTVKFDLDSEWDALTNRTMVVAYSDHTMASPVLFTGDTVSLPQVQGHEIAYIGLKAGNLHTTTPAVFICDRSISTIGGTITPPSTEVWNQIIAKLDEIEDELDDKQDTLTAGTGISIVDNVISATGSASVTRSAIETALGAESPNLSANDYSNTEKASVTANTAARHTHDNKAVLDAITSGKTSAWDAKSTVSVSASGTATDEVQYITINGTEKKLAGGGVSDFDELTNRPKYNGSSMTHATNIPEVKTAAWDGKYAKPADGIPSTDMASAVQTSLGKADSALQSVPSTYRTAAEQDAIHDATKQDVISDIATIRSGAALGATALQSVPNTYRTAAAQDVIDTQLNQALVDKQDKLIAGQNITIAADGRTISATCIDYFTVQNGKVCAVYEGGN